MLVSRSEGILPLDKTTYTPASFTRQYTLSYSPPGHPVYSDTNVTIRGYSVGPGLLPNLRLP